MHDPTETAVAVSLLASQLARYGQVLGRRVADGFTVADMEAFVLIAKCSLIGEPLTTADVARALRLNTPQAHQLVRRLVAENLVTKKPNSTDARANDLELSDHGKEVVGRMIEVFTQHRRQA